VTSVPRFISFDVDKRGRKRAYERGYGYRMFPMPLAMAENLIATGQAERDLPMAALRVLRTSWQVQTIRNEADGLSASIRSDNDATWIVVLRDDDAAESFGIRKGIKSQAEAVAFARESLGLPADEATLTPI
jgi:hypothetical protein